jgi:16S rRNA processing protein RimM
MSQPAAGSLSSSASTKASGDSLVPIGRIVGSYGVRGALRVKAYSADASNLLAARSCAVTSNSGLPRPTLTELTELRSHLHGQHVIVQAKEISDRSAADSLKAAEICVPRAALAAPSPDEHYWIDLIGCDVENAQGILLGRVSSLLSTGAHDVLEIVHTRDEKPAMRLIPFVSAYILSVDIAAKHIVVSWEADWD